MTKILLVEDDKSLREIYGVRLLAEGYDIVSAGDGEEALAMAIKDRPTLIVSDVMMPKISGFDMLDILRSTTETKDIKVIMMTALSSDDQRKRGEELGADRYLVKSQVGIEDVVRTVHEVLEDAPVSSASFSSPLPTSAPTRPAPSSAPPQRPTTPSQPLPLIPQPAAPTGQPPVLPQQSPLPTPTPVPEPQPAPNPPSASPSAGLPQPTAPFSTPRQGNLASRVIEPISSDADARADNVAAQMQKELDTAPSVKPLESPLQPQLDQAPAAPFQRPTVEPTPTPVQPAVDSNPSATQPVQVNYEETPRTN